jgi:hypothetical protein
LLQRKDGARFVVALTASNPSASIDENDAVSIGNGIIGLLAAA